MNLKGFIAAVALTVIAGAAQAATVQFSLSIGKVTEANNTLVHDFTDFQLGELVTMTIEVDDSVIDINGSNGVGIWEDPTGTISLNSASGSVTLATGVRFKSTGYNGETTISSLANTATAATPIIMSKGSGGAVFGSVPGYVDGAIAGGGNPLSDLLALLPIPGGSSIFVDIPSVVTTDNPAGDETGLVIGPVPVPLPAAGLLLAGAIGALTIRRRRKAAA